MAKCKFCGEDYKKANGCIRIPVKHEGKIYEPIKVGDGGDYIKDSNGRCGFCGAKFGNYHHPGCSAERCPVCGGQLISCGCMDEISENDKNKNDIVLKIIKNAFTPDEIASMYNIALKREQEYKNKIKVLESELKLYKNTIKNPLPFEFGKKVYVIDNFEFKSYHEDEITEYKLVKDCIYIYTKESGMFHISKIGKLIFENENDLKDAIENERHECV